MSLITINGISLDPASEGAVIRAASPDSGNAADSDHVLVQVDSPLSGDDRRQLTERGAQVDEYVGDDVYLCSFTGTDLEELRALPFVVWADVYLRVFKVAPVLRGVPSPVRVESLAATVGPSASRRTRQVDVLLHAGVDPGSVEVRTRVAAAARLAVEAVQPGRRKLRLVIQERHLDDLAALDEVRVIEEVGQAGLGNDVARTILNATVVVNGTSYQGDGEVVAVADTGLDKGSTTNVHAAFTGRVARLYALGRTGPDLTDDPDGHGTHVAGSVLGDGSSASMGGVIQGTAPRARLVLQSLLDSSGTLGGIPADLHDLFEPPYDNDGARVHTNSWYRFNQGSTPSHVPLPYDQGAREIDDVVWNRQDLVICFCAGNQGVDIAPADGVVEAGQIGSVSAAKNCITVGASESVRDLGIAYGDISAWQNGQVYAMPPINRDDMSDDAAGMAAFSSRGPTPEGRIKPDVVAPGTAILSARSAAVATPVVVFGTSSDDDWFFDSGTSMATPLVAGCAAVLRETLVTNGAATPSAALIKALLINGAVQLTGQYTPSEAGPSPNNSSGFGRVDLAGSVILPGPDPDAGLGEGGPLDQGESESFPVDIPRRPPGKPGSAGAAPAGAAGDSSGGAGGGVTFKVTLVWADPAGQALQNDLDLVVVAADGSERHGNMGTAKGFDRQNNVEQVVWDNMPAGQATVTVTAFRITQFAQPYAYAWRIS